MPSRDIYKPVIRQGALPGHRLVRSVQLVMNIQPDPHYLYNYTLDRVP